MSRKTISLLVAVAAIAIALGGCGGNERLNRLRQEYVSWTVEQPRPPLWLTVPSVSDRQTVKISVRTDWDGIVLVRVIDSFGKIILERAEKDGLIITPSLDDGNYVVLAEAKWCLTIPNKYREVASDLFCPSSLDKKELVVDTTEPQLQIVGLSDEGESFLLEGTVSDVNKIRFIAIEGLGAVLVADGKFFSRVPYETVKSRWVTARAVDLAGNIGRSIETAIPQCRDCWVRTSRNGEYSVRPASFDPGTGGLFGFGRGVVWTRYTDGQVVDQVWSPDLFYDTIPIGFAAIPLVAFGLFLYWQVTKNLSLEKSLLVATAILGLAFLIVLLGNAIKGMTGWGTVLLATSGLLGFATGSSWYRQYQWHRFKQHLRLRYS